MRCPWTLLLLLSLAPRALADDEHEHERARDRVAIDPTYASECGSCHFAYPPDLLPARSWSALLQNLPAHFGDDATLGEPTRTQLETWLVANAADVRAEGGAPLRVTETGWWRHEHDEIPAAWAQEPAIRSFASCPACHTEANRGSFREGEIQIPGHGGWDD
jgi:hypothetical protein